LDAAAQLDAVVANWEAVVRVDASLYTDPDPAIPCPVTDPERIFPLDLAENLIGRRSDRLDIHPEIPLTDPGVSHRHAKIYREADGSLSVLDVGSTNATNVNGNEAAAGVRVSLNDGDEITIGCWTRILIRRTTP
jgi:pSer/pThr/pTyr-binding forkhead associated (FHA) protein